MICFAEFSKELLSFLMQYIIVSKEIQKKHKFKNGELVFYYDSCFSNIHRLNLKKNAIDIGIVEEVLCNTKCYNEGKEWDLLTGIYFYLPNNEKLTKLINESKGEKNEKPI